MVYYFIIIFTAFVYSLDCDTRLNKRVDVILDLCPNFPNLYVCGKTRNCKRRHTENVLSRQNND